MKRTLSFFLSLIMVIGIIASVPITVSAASVDDLTFELNEDGKSYSVADCDESAEGELIIPDMYNGLPVDNIADWTFGNCESITSISIPDSIKTIGIAVFSYCTSLISINVDNNNLNYSSIDGILFSKDNCTLLQYPSGKIETIYTIPDFVTEIGNEAFFECTNLISIEIPITVTAIGNGAFCGCSNLKSIQIPDSVTKIEAGTFYECSNLENFVISNTVTSIGNQAFELCTNLSSITIPDSVKSIGWGAFFNCTSLQSVVIGNSVTSIEKQTFYSCTSLTSITIPNSVTTIGNYAFRGCTSLSSITIPNSVTNIGNLAFCDCTSLTSITIPDSVTSIGKYAFDNCTNLTSITIPDSVKSIGWSAFYNCTSLESAVIGNSVTSIEEQTFYSCTNLKFVTIGGSVTSISESVFAYCESLRSITIPNSVTTIGGKTFYACTSLTSISIPDSILNLGDKVFDYCGELKYVFYSGSEDDWVNITTGDSDESLSKAIIHYNSTNHSYEEKIDSEVTCTKDGSKHKECIVCGYSLDDEAIPALGHNYSTEWTIDKPSTCTEKGSKSHHCLRCDNITDITVIPPNEHSYVDGLCTICDKTVGMEYLTFTLNNDGESYSIIDCDEFAEGELIIPKIYNGLPVTNIGEEAFSHCGRLTSVTIPDSVTSISRGAFFSCLSLLSVSLPKGIKKIDFDTFSGCINLTSVTIPDSVLSICSGAFSDCKNLIDITIPDSVTSIGAEAFYKTGYYNNESNWENDVLYINNNLIDTKSTITGKYSIKSGTKTIANYAFDYCENLTSITIPDSVISIGHFAFWDCRNLTSVTIGKGARNIGNNAFSWCESITSIIIPDSVTSIGESAFEYCSNLTSIIIPTSVTSIGNSAFYNCLGLNYVFYKGTQDDKDDISIGSSNSYFADAAWHYEATGHTESNWIFDKVSTCIVEGSQHKECTVCGKVLETKKLPLSSHTSSSWITDKKATVNAAGKKHKECTECGEVLETTEIPQLKPSTPKLTSASRVSNGVKVSWGAVEGADEYIVYRKTAKSGWSRLGSTTSTSFTDTKATTGTTYYYTVKAQNEARASGYNKTGLKIKYVAAPKLTKIANESSGVRVYWSKVAGADGYYLYRRVAGSKTWTKIATIKKGTTTSYLDTKASAAKTYEYIIKCYDGSTPSASAAKTIKIKRLTVPKLVSAKSAKAGVTVKWGKVAGAEGYYVYRKTGSGSWVKLTTVKGNTKVSYVDKSAKKGKTYTYTVKAYSGSYTSAYNTKGLKIKDKY